MKKIIILCILISVVFSSNNYDAKEQRYQEKYQQSIQGYDNLMNNIIDRMTTDENIGTYSMGFDSAFICGVINLIQSVANIFYFGDDPDGYNLEAIIGRDDYRPSYYLEYGFGTDWDRFSFVGALEYFVYLLPKILAYLFVAYLIYRLLLKLQVKDNV
ncbi:MULTISPECIES: hypothetical protein [unclassified Campylobacter]|uniref:hypothetical protein n=2 Tax=unclassified Campylobacter TaxID=2593542 RepID=UPI001810A048|nr:MULTISPECIES: hypothetical protein [unclassified Campylobacter]EAI4450023.1 hypothetical protein [Campylobacter lari]MCV3357015.1 hypothetical protein [Campylobacter sp. RKI_CA19_01122]MCV3376029.1 hypothetical protein [Campylobacter sp. IFREMER_LSEM_CL2151]MCV3426268.1 hypothetical protein [Campylobacter lari]HEC1755656.1 hypothetical protein [Campylobacter lari]